MRTIFALTLLGAVVSTDAFAASFDCSKAGTLVENAICSDPTLSELDNGPSQAYKAALAGSTAPEALKADQKAWLSQRNQCRDASCLRAAYQTRLSVLQAAAKTTEEKNSVTGTYKSRNGEVLVLQTGPNRIKFALSASYGMNTGEVSGEAPFSKNNAIYASEPDDCVINFKFSSRSLDLAQEGTCGMGFNVFGTGTYKLASPNPPKL